ncbi:MAG: hypothetical protein OEW00_01390, partial [candidate division Zixibacteria bacterium]|nr:hypothetical protein [candidate division Zixibacteria bacterium]
MKRYLTVPALSAALLISASLPAADTKVNGRVYSNWMMDLTDGADSFNEFTVSRAYVTVRSKLSEYTSVRITTDLRTIDNVYDIILKYAYLDWKPAFADNYATLRFGLQPTLYVDHMNNLWGRRYLEKTTGDLNKFLTSSDMGASVMVGLGQNSRYGVASLAVFNGTSYSEVQELNKQKDINAFIMINPLESNPRLKNSAFMAQYYRGTQNEAIEEVEVISEDLLDTTTVPTNVSDWKRELISVGGLLAYNGTIGAGFDLNFTTMGTGPADDAVSKSAISFFGTLYMDALAESAPLLRTLNLFGRVDMVDPDTDTDDDGKTLIIAGVECAPIKEVKASVNYRTTSFQDDSEDTKSMLYL